MYSWYFPSNDFGEIKGINDTGPSIFRGHPLSSLAREVCQNSLDASTAEKILVEFNSFSVPYEKLPGVKELAKVFDRCADYWKNEKSRNSIDFFANAIEKIQSKYIEVLRVSDFHTTGLTGSKEYRHQGSNWVGLTRSSGVSDKDSTAGGSFGIGKFAAFACSDFSTVFYSTYDIEGIRAYQGVSRLVTFVRDDELETQGTGYYGGDRCSPIYDEFHLEQGFNRTDDSPGTDIYVIGYRYAEEDWKKDIIISVLDSFLGALWNERMEVRVGDIKVDRHSLDRLVKQYEKELSGNTLHYYRVLTSDETSWFTGDILGMGQVRLGLLVGDPKLPRKVCMIRKTGMKIKEQDRFNKNVPFAGIMFIEGDALNGKLREMENPEHTEWQTARASDPRLAKKIIKALREFIRKHLDDLTVKSEEEVVDAAGLSHLLPQLDGDKKDMDQAEALTGKIINIEKKQRRTSIKKVPSYEASQDLELQDMILDDDGFVEHLTLAKRIKKNRSPGPKTPVPDPDGDPDRQPGGGKTPSPSRPHYENRRFKEVSPQQIHILCTDKEAGRYSLTFTPATDGSNGEIALFISAETQKYNAPILNAVPANPDSPPVSIEGNKITGLHFKRGCPLSLDIVLNYTDYCSLEVTAHAH